MGFHFFNKVSFFNQFLYGCKHFPNSPCFLGFRPKYLQTKRQVLVVASPLVSISMRCKCLSEKSVTGFIQEPKAIGVIVRDYNSGLDKPDETDFLEKKQNFMEKFAGSLTEHEKEEMLVYEFMRCDVFKEESYLHDDGFIELIPNEEEEEEEGYDFDDDDDDDEFDHSDVVERLKAEIRSSRTGGLCTILEESETPLEELKPLKIDSKPDLKDKITEIHKVYKNYAIRMRKLDVLDSQTMHSISLLKLRNNEKSPIKAPKSPVRTNLWPFKKQEMESDPIDKLVKDASKDFETVYVGQICLSWEMLRWQYTKVLEFQQNDTQSICQYNLVAGEFQLFQVLLQRFVESEPFQNSSRVESYLKNRRHFHNFLQIPLVRDDRSWKSKKCKNEGEFAVKIESLREIIEESMRVFFEFVCRDKDEFSSMLKVSYQTQVSPQDPLDLQLLTDIRIDLHKKEKKIKEIVRSQTCMVKKLKKNVGVVKDELMIAQIELKLVSRVTNMSKLTTEKLAWCKERLNKISFNGRKIHMEPSFSLLPC